MPAVALSRAGARGRIRSRRPGAGRGGVAEAGDAAGPALAAGRVYPLACLIAIALCAFTAAGNDRLTAVGQWIRRASQADLARLRAPWDPMAGRYRAPDEKTIRVVLDRLDPRALARRTPPGSRSWPAPPIPQRRKILPPPRGRPKPSSGTEPHR
jgi:hypothetical protein